jgi:lipopolysaccharide export system permease protein
MTWLFGRLSRYILIETLWGVLIAAAAVAFAVTLVDLVEQMRTVSAVPGASPLLGFQLVLMRVPGIMDQAIPFAVLVGAVMTFLRLSRRSEIVAMRAAGVSAWHFLAPAATLSGLIGLGMILLLGPFGATLNDRYTDIRAELEASRSAEGPGSTPLVWRAMQIEGGRVLISGMPQGDGTGRQLSDATFQIIPEDASEPDRRIDAARAELGSDGNWVLTRAVESRAGFRPTSHPVLQIATIDPTEAQRDGLRDPRDLPVWALPGAARQAQASGASPDRYLLRFHRQLALPVTLVAMTLIAAVLSLGLDRAGGRLMMTVGALAAGLLVFFANDITGALASAGYAPPWIAAWSPPLVAMLMALTAVSYREDG